MANGVRGDGYYRFFPGDYLRDTGGLSLVEHGAYRLLLDHYYSEAGNVSGEKPRLYRLCRATTPEEQLAVDFIVGRYFVVINGVLTNNRADRELQEREQFIEEQRRKGKLGGRPPKKANNNPGDNPGDNPGVSPGFEKQKPKETPAPASASASALPPEPKEKTKALRRGKPQPRAFVLPGVIFPETWKAFEEHRNRLRKPMTERARHLIVREIEKIGGDPNALLDQSIRKGWQDVFPIKNNGTDPPKRKSGCTHVGCERKATMRIDGRPYCPEHSQGAMS